MSSSVRAQTRDVLQAVLVAVALVAPLVAAAPPAAAAAARTVFTTTNADGPNELVAYERGRAGDLTEVARIATGGTGLGERPGSQGAVEVHRRWLFAVNGGSNSVSSFSLRGRQVELVGTEPSGGSRPVSVAAHGHLLYVLNADGAGSISGFRIGPRGTLTPLADSTRPLSGAEMTMAAQISFTADGSQLVVTERATDRITTFIVGADGRPSAPVVHVSAGVTPFGFDVDRRGRLFVSEAFGGAPDASAVSSYELGRDGSLDAISPSVGTTETAACWVVVSRNGRYLYTTNTGSGSVTGYRIARDGSITPLDADGVTADTGADSAPVDAALSADGRVLYVLHGGTGEIGAYAVGRRGDLTEVGDPVPGLPDSALGLAAT